MTAFSGQNLMSGFDSMLNLNSADLAAQIVQMEDNQNILPVNNEIIVDSQNGRITQEVQDTSPMLSSASHSFMNHQPQPTSNDHMRTFLDMKPFNEMTEPEVVITEQPRQRGLRFRYQCEGRSAGSIPGEHSSAEKKTYPTIKIKNHSGPAIVVVSCVTKEPPHKPHPHSLVGKDCKKGVCTIKVKDTSVISFPHLGIQCAKKKGIQESLDLRKSVNVDPFQTGFEFVNSTAEMSVVRLCFQVFLPDANGKITKVLQPVVSEPIHDKKALNDLIICRVDKSSGKARGGDEVFVLCEKINKDDIGIRFYEEKKDGSVVWENFGEFGAGDVHRQYAIVFKTPAYRDSYINKPVQVCMQLHRPSDGETSEPINFIYMPEDPDPDRIEEKRKRKADRMVNLVQDHMNPGPRMGGANVNIKEGLRSKLKANRKIPSANEIKSESDNSGLTAYSLSNIGSSGFTTQSSNTTSYNFNNSGSVMTVNTSFPSNSTSNILQTSNTVYEASQTQQSLAQSATQIDNTINFDPSSLDPQILLEYLQDKGIKADGQDILSFESLDMLPASGEFNFMGLQNVGANELVDSSVQDSTMDSDSREMFQCAQDSLRNLQK